MQQERVIALGLFDGVHLGHAALLKEARHFADLRGVLATALTFDPPPARLVTGKSTALLNTVEDRQGLITRLFHLDEVLVCGFDRSMQEMHWRDYVEFFLCNRLGACHLICGQDHRFGRDGEGDAERLRIACKSLGIRCTVVGEVLRGGISVSSTRIRSLLASGDLDGANDLLGHPHCLTGTVVHGQGLGASLGTPTANVPLPPGVLSPVFGVYASRVHVNGRSWDAVTNVGVRPTVDGGKQILCEPWLLDFSGDLYGKELRIEFHKFLRPERRFPSLDALRTAILENAAETRDYFTILRNCEALFGRQFRP